MLLRTVTGHQSTLSNVDPTAPLSSLTAHLPQYDASTVRFCVKGRICAPSITFRELVEVGSEDDPMLIVVALGKPRVLPSPSGVEGDEYVPPSPPVRCERQHVVGVTKGGTSVVVAQVFNGNVPFGTGIVQGQVLQPKSTLRVVLRTAAGQRSVCDVAPDAVLLNALSAELPEYVVSTLRFCCRGRVLSSHLSFAALGIREMDTIVAIGRRAAT